MNGPVLIACIAVVVIVLALSFWLGILTNVLTVGFGLLLAAGTIGALRAIGLALP